MSKKILYKKFNDFPIKLVDVEPDQKVIKGVMGGMLSKMRHIDATDANCKLADKHNKLLNEIREKQIELQRLSDKIFK